MALRWGLWASNQGDAVSWRTDGPKGQEGGHQNPTGDVAWLHEPPNPPPGWRMATQKDVPWRTQPPPDTLLALTVHGEVDGLLAGEGVIGDGHLHLVRAFVAQLQGADEQRAILQHPDAVAVIGPQVADDLGADGLDDGDGFVPFQLPLDHRLVGAGAGVAHREQRRLPRRATHQRRGAGDVHPRQETLGWGGQTVGTPRNTGNPLPELG